MAVKTPKYTVEDADVFFGKRSGQALDLELLQRNRPLGPPGTSRWRYSASPMVEQHLADKRRAAEIRAQQR